MKYIITLPSSGCIICKGKYAIENSIGRLGRVHYRGKCLQNIHSVHSRRLQDRIHSSLHQTQLLLFQIQLLPFPNASAIFFQIQLPSFKYKFPNIWIRIDFESDWCLRGHWQKFLVPSKEFLVRMHWNQGNWLPTKNSSSTDPLLSELIISEPKFTGLHSEIFSTDTSHQIYKNWIKVDAAYFINATINGIGFIHTDRYCNMQCPNNELHLNWIIRNYDFPIKVAPCSCT